MADLLYLFTTVVVGKPAGGVRGRVGHGTRNCKVLDPNSNRF